MLSIDASMRRLLLALAHANVLIALHATGYAAAALVLAGREPSLLALALPTAAMYAVYTYDKVARFDPQDEVNDPERSALIRRWRRPLLISGAAAMLGGGAAALACGPLAALLFLTPLIAGVLYALPLPIPGRRAPLRIKDVTGLKSLYVAATWALTAGALPLVVDGATLDPSPALALIAAWIFARIVINTVYFDLGDMVGDLAAGTRTIPIALGFQRTRALLLAINGASALLLSGGAALGLLPGGAHVIAAIALYGLAYLVLADEGRDLGFLCDVIVDGEGALVGVLSLIAAATAAAGLALAVV